MLWLPVVSLLLVSGILVWQITATVRTAQSIALADRNFETTTELSSLVVDEETGLRGYQITRNQIFLQPYEAAGRPLANAFADLRAGLSEQGSSLQPVDELVAAHAQWQSSFAVPVITATAAGRDTADSGLNLRGKGHMDVVRAQIAALSETQRQIRTREVARREAQVRHTLEAVVGLCVVIGLMIGVYSRSQVHAVSAAFQRALDSLRRQGQQVHASEQRLRTILASIVDAVVVCDATGCVEMMNPVAQELSGWKESDALGKSIDTVFRLVHESTRGPLETPVSVVLRENRAVSLEHHAVLLRDDGAEIHIDRSGAPLSDRNGSLSGVVMVFRDITNQRHTQAALLASEKLSVAGRLASTIAHEIHNPLDAVMNLIYLLRTGATPDESKMFLDMASRELDRVAQISRAMLGMYRDSRNPVALDLSGLLEKLLMLLGSHFMQARVEVKADLAPGCIVTGYPSELRQVFTNLLTNALDASAPGSVIEVATRIRPESDDVLTTITDHGRGVSAAARGHLFQPFFTTKGENGTGLGLWVSQGLLHKHGGSIELDTHCAEDGDDRPCGTTVRVVLPRGTAPWNPDRPESD